MRRGLPSLPTGDAPSWVPRFLGPPGEVARHPLNGAFGVPSQNSVLFLGVWHGVATLPLPGVGSFEFSLFYRGF